MTDAFFSKSDGHPLHLRYALLALRERGLPVTSDSIRSLPGSAQPDIERYYEELWRSLPEEGRRLLHLLAATRFVWPPAGLVECLAPTGQDEARVHDALRQVRHLLVDEQ